MTMNRKQASRLVKDKYGPNADAVRVSNVLDRNQRFGVSYVTPGGPSTPPMLFVLGYGPSFESAVAMAEVSEQGKVAAEAWDKAKAEFEEFRKDPHAVLEKMKATLQAAEDDLQSSQQTKTDDAVIL